MIPVQQSTSSSSLDSAALASTTPPSLRIFRGHSFSTLPSAQESITEERKKNLVISDRGQVRDAEKSYSVVSKREPAIFIQMPMSNFVGNCITIPVITFKSWYGKVISVLLAETKKTDFSNRAIQKTIDDTYRRCLEYSSIRERIAMASYLLGGSSDYAFLNDFIQDTRPLIFWEKYKKLEFESSSKFKLLYEVMGRQEAFTILIAASESNGNKIKNRFNSQIDVVAPLEKKKQAFFKCSIFFPDACDPGLLRYGFIPPFAQNYKEFAETFRSFLSNGPFPKKCIRFNNECLIVPDYNKLGLEESDREEHFIKWLISEFQRKMNIGLAPDPKTQIQAFGIVPNLDPKFVKNKLRPLIIKSLNKEFKKTGPREDLNGKLGSFFDKFQKETVDFSVQLLPFSKFLCTYLMNYPPFEAKNWEEVSDTLISWYGRLYQFKEKQSLIPSLALMQSMGYPSYAICGRFLNGIGKPRQFWAASNSYQLVLNRERIGFYDIRFRKDCFSTVHTKWFNVVYNNFVKAKILIHWKVSGMLNSIHHSFKLTSDGAHFSPECSDSEKLMILDQLSLAFLNINEAGSNGAAPKS